MDDDDNPLNFLRLFLGVGVGCMGNLALYVIAVFSLVALERFVPAIGSHAFLTTTLLIIVLADFLVIRFLRRRDQSVLIGLVIATAVTAVLSALGLFLSYTVELPN